MTESFSDSSSIFLSEDNDGTYGMGILYDGVGNDLEIYGKSESNFLGPHFILDRGSGQLAIPGSIVVGGEEEASGYVLSINGKAICEELQVEFIADWPDYVFEESYPLLSIDEMADFIESKGHLPGIPPSRQVESQGFAVGDMQKRMLEKVEELTLYVIQLHEENVELKKQLETLKNQMQ